jgi:hypothetical protein
VQAARNEITNEDFFRALRDSNPFTKNRVSEVGDVESEDQNLIHIDAFRELSSRIDRVRRNKTSAGVMVLGAAGVGKSHLLAHMCQWARRDGRSTTVFLHNVLASPQRMARYLLRATVSALAGYRTDAYCESDLYQLLNHAVSARLAAAGRHGVPSTELRLETLSQVFRGSSEDATIVHVLAEFLEAAIQARDGKAGAEQRAIAAVEWLSGEVIDPDVADDLGLPAASEDGALLGDDAGIEGVFRVLARLASASDRVFVLCVDQVDNLDAEQVTALAAFLHVLVDHTRHMVVVTSGVRQSMLAFREQGIIPEAAWDRLGQYVVELRRIDAEKARELVETRIGKFAQPFRTLPSVASMRSRDHLFPLDGAWLSKRLSDGIEFRPRDVISWAHARWEEQQNRLERHGQAAWLQAWPSDGPAGSQIVEVPFEQVVDSLAGMKLAERAQQRLLQPELLPPDADNLATLVSSLLAHCAGDPRYSVLSVERCVARRGTNTTYDLLVRERRPDGTPITTGVLFVTSNNKISAAGSLRRMAEDRNPPEHRILVTDEERRPLPLGPRGQEYYEALCALGSVRFIHTKLSLAEYANLDALAGLVASARVGDLDIEHPVGCPRSVTEREAVESLHRGQRLLANRLLRELLTEGVHERADTEPPGPVLPDRIAVIMQEHLSWRLGLTSRELTNHIIESEHVDSSHSDRLHVEVVDVGRVLHSKGVIHATAENDGLFLQFLAAR